MLEKIKKIVEENPIALATVNNKNNPHVVVVAYAKVKDNKIIITDNYMKNSIENIKINPNVSLAVWDSDWEGFRITGHAEYVQEGEYVDLIKNLKENKGMPCKGAIVILVDEVNKLA